MQAMRSDMTTWLEKSFVQNYSRKTRDVAKTSMNIVFLQLFATLIFSRTKHSAMLLLRRVEWANARANAYSRC